MSNHLISTTYKRDLRTPMRKCVMALFADKASDDGSGIYASKQTMADELCCSKQALLDTIKGFMADGLLVELGQRRSPNGYTVEYGIVVEALEALPLVACHAARTVDRSTPRTSQPAGPVKLTPRTSQPAGPVKLTPRTSQPAGPKPSRTQPLKATPPKVKRASKSHAFVPPSDIPESEWDAFEEMRKRMGKPMTDKARDLAVARLRRFAEDGYPPGDVLNHSILNNYQGLFAPKDDRNGRMAGDHRSRSGRGVTVDAALGFIEDQRALGR